MPSGSRPRGPQKKVPQKKGTQKRTNVKVPSGAGGEASRRILAIGGAGGIVVIAAALGFFLRAGGSSASADPQKLLRADGCRVEAVKSMKAGDHSVLTPAGISTKWNTSPPTNGPHYGVPAVWGAYTEPLLPAQVVHNLEHGGIFIQYGKDVPRATVDELKAFYDKHRDGTLLAPLPSLGSKIALGAWTTVSASQPNSGTAYLAKCSSFDEKAYAAFFADYQFEGPERFPKSTLTPGS